MPAAPSISLSAQLLSLSPEGTANEARRFRRSSRAISTLFLLSVRAAFDRFAYIANIGDVLSGDFQNDVGLP